MYRVSCYLLCPPDLSFEVRVVFILFIKLFLHQPLIRHQIDAADVRCVNGALHPQGHLCLESWTGFAHVLNQANPHDLACELYNLMLEWFFPVFSLFHFSYLSIASVTFRIIWIPCAYVKVSQSCPTLCSPMNCSLPGSSLRGLPQATVLEWVANSFSRGSSPPRD